MWAIAKHILYQGRKFSGIFLISILLLIFIEHPYWVYICCIFVRMFLYLFWQRQNIRIYRTLPISKKQVANMGWFTSVIVVHLCAFGFFLIYFLGRYYHSVQNFWSEINFSTILLFFFLFVSSTSLIFTIIVSPTLYYRLKLDPHSTMSRNKYILLIFIGLLFYFPLIVLLLDSPPIWSLIIALLASLLSFYASRNVTGKIFINGWLWDESIVKSSSNTTHYQKTDNKTMLPRFSVLFGLLKFYAIIWLVYFLGIKIMSSIIDLFEPVNFPIDPLSTISFVFILFIDIILLSSAFIYSIRILPILLLLPLHRLLLVFYLVAFPALSILIGIALGMI